MRVLTFLLLLSAPFLQAADPALTQIKTVYLMPMANGLDQYLANQLIEDRIFNVVTDPAEADAVFTERIGKAFEEALTELYPPPPPPPTEQKEEKPAAPESTTIGAALSERPDVPGRVSAFSRGRGNVFLVDRKTKRVLWSYFQPPRNSRPDEVHRTADKIIGRLGDDLDRLLKPAKP